MTIREDILKAARGEMPERVPYVMYPALLPRGEVERSLRSRGLGLLGKMEGSTARSDLPNVEIAQRTIIRGGKRFLRTSFRTPVGELAQLGRLDYAAGMAGMAHPWLVEYPIKRVADYEVLEFIVRDRVFNSPVQGALDIARYVGDDGVQYAGLPRTPYQRLLIWYTGVERLALDLKDDPEPVERVMAAMIETDRAWWQMVAEVPVEILVQCPDNISAEIVGPRRFEKYLLPYYRAAYEVLHPAGKTMVIHIDGKMRALADSINELPRGIVIEAFTPEPTGDYSLAEARANWKDRPILINFPSSVHLRPPAEIEAVTLDLLRQAAPGQGFLLGITENIPKACWQDSLMAISRVLEQHGACPIRL